MMNIKYLPKAARMHFLPASILPFLLGAAYAAGESYDIRSGRLIPAIFGIASAHLAGNLFNDFFDYKSGADNFSAGSSPFFGGSGVIQKKMMSSLEVKTLALAFLSIALICGMAVTLATGSRLLPAVIAMAAVLTVEYTAPPLKLAYRRMGEILIFTLFGILPTMAGFYIFSEEITLRSFQLALPLSFLIFSVIICNEIPDSSNDSAVGKKNLISLSGAKNGGILYGISIFASLAAFTYLSSQGIISGAASIGTIFYLPAITISILLCSGRGGIKTASLASAVTIITHFSVGSYMIANILKTR